MALKKEAARLCSVCGLCRASCIQLLVRSASASRTQGNMSLRAGMGETCVRLLRPPPAPREGLRRFRTIASTGQAVEARSLVYLIQGHVDPCAEMCLGQLQQSWCACKPNTCGSMSATASSPPLPTHPSQTLAARNLTPAVSVLQSCLPSSPASPVPCKDAA